MSPSSKSSGSMSPLSPTPSHDPPADHGLHSPGRAQEFDDIYMEEEAIPDDSAMHEDKAYHRKGKGKARQRSLSRTPHSGPLTVDTDVLDVVAKQAYLSPPLTSSDSFLFGVHNISLALRKGLSSIDFDVDLDLQSGSERSSSPDGHSSSSTTSGEQDEGEFEVGEAVVETAVSEFLEEVDEFSILTPSAPSEAESSRKATVGDTTLQDAGSVLPAVRFPSIFTQDMDYSSLESSRTGTPLLPVSSPIVFDDFEHPRRQEKKEGPVGKESGGGILIHHQSIVDVGVKSKRKRVLRRRLKIQEKGLTRDFLLIITLCFGMACAGILIVRPTLMALYGYDTLGGRLDLDFDY